MPPDKRAAGLLIMIGIPGSGKTTLAQRLVPPSKVVSTDAIRAELFGDEAIQGSWAKIEAHLKVQLLAAQANCDPHLVVYDATNAVRRQRRRFLQQARQMGFGPIYGYWLDLPLSLCLARNHQRSRQVPGHVIARMHRCLSGAPPQLSEGFDGLVRMSFPALGAALRAERCGNCDRATGITEPTGWEEIDRL